ncbi:MAG: DUF3565 domain-containing protein [Myxococcales bacterium]|nr:DUF3565 domain-containing protein [Myxococcales bacterium]
MHRAIESFVQDELGDWVAILVCGHGQHVRHKPPFFPRPWVLAEDTRTARIGTPLECVRCDRFELPPAFTAYKRTPEFEASTIPAALRKDHSTKPGVWGVIHVTAGQLQYIVEAPLARESVVDAEHPGIVVPEVLHRVSPIGEVRFFVEFHRRPPV